MQLRLSLFPILTAALLAVCTTLECGPAHLAVGPRLPIPRKRVVENGSNWGNEKDVQTGPKQRGSCQPAPTPGPAREQQMPITLVNLHRESQLYAYVVGFDASRSPVALVPPGQWFRPRPTSSTLPQPLETNISWRLPARGESLSVTIPGDFISGRVYVSEGELSFSSIVTSAGPRLVEPGFLSPTDSNANQSWSYVELTVQASETFADITYVDFVSLPLALRLENEAGVPAAVSGVNSSAARLICEGLRAYTERDGQPWEKLCRYDDGGRLVRVISPDKYISMDEGAFAGYYEGYVREAYQRFSGNATLQVGDLDPSFASIHCRTDGDGLHCDGASRAFEKPTTAQILACNGILGVAAPDNEVVALVAPRLCAAFHRSTLLLDGGEWQPRLPATSYYLSPPTNRYAQLVHDFAPDGVGYAFPFDDVHPKGARDESGLLHRSDVTSLTIVVGDG